MLFDDTLTKTAKNESKLPKSERKILKDFQSQGLTLQSKVFTFDLLNKHLEWRSMFLRWFQALRLLAYPLAQVSPLARIFLWLCFALTLRVAWFIAVRLWHARRALSAPNSVSSDGSDPLPFADVPSTLLTIYRRGSRVPSAYVIYNGISLQIFLFRNLSDTVILRMYRILSLILQ